MIFPVGPLINAAAIVAGSVLGLAAGSRLPEKIRDVVFQGLGLCTLVIGLQMALKTNNALILVLSILLGAIAGTLLNLEDRFLALGDILKKRLHSRNPRFTDGLVNSSILFCIGAMAIVGSLDEGLRGDLGIVLSKSVMDGFAAIAFASAYGIGVAFAALPLLLYQGALVLAASLLQPWLSQTLVTELSATGGVLILGIAFNMLGLTQIKLSNLLPALPVAAALAVLPF